MNKHSIDPLAPETQRWIRVGAGLTGGLALLGLIGLWAATAQGAPNTPNNPFATPGGGDTFFEDDEGFDFPEDPFVPPHQGFYGNEPAANPAYNNNNTPSPPSGGGAKPSVSLGGKPPGEGARQNNNSAPIRLDTETGEGSKDMVTDFNFPDADIMDIAKTLGKLTGKNFIFDKDVKGRISIISNSAITVGDAWKAFLTALDVNGFALIPSGKYLRISRQRDARDKQLRTYTGDFSPDTDALITRVFPLKYIGAEEVARTFRSFMPANSRIIPYDQTNTVIVTDTGSNIAKLAKILEILDIEGYDAGIEVVPVKFASADGLAKLIDSLLPGTTAPGQPAGQPRFGRGGFNARRTKEGGIINNIIADERTNTLIVHANGKGADQVRDLVVKLDQKVPSTTGGGKVHVIYLQFADSEQVAGTLNNLSQGAARPGGGFGGFGGGPPGAAGTGVNPVTTSLFEGSIKVASDKATNSLVVTASPGDFVTVQRVINRLDIPRDQVYVEVVIMEITLNRDFDYSANFISPASAFLGSVTNLDLANFIANPIGTKGAIIPFASGEGTFTIGNEKKTLPNVAALIKFIQTNSNANVLATPQIVALDNEEALFESSEKIPTQSGSTAVQGVGTQAAIVKEDVSLTIKIKPQINKMSNFVRMKVNAKIADISTRGVPESLNKVSFAQIVRNADTSVVVGDGDTIVIGGLTRDKQSETTNKVPLLGDIPLLGWLFKSKSTTSEKTNLLIFLTPRIIRQYEKVRMVLDRKLKERDDFIEEHAGGKDHSRRYRDDMIRGLPNLDDLKKQPPTSITLDDEPMDLPPRPATRVDTSQNDAPPGGVPPAGGGAAVPSLDPMTPPPPANQATGPIGGDAAPPAGGNINGDGSGG